MSPLQGSKCAVTLLPRPPLRFDLGYDMPAFQAFCFLHLYNYDEAVVAFAGYVYVVLAKAEP